MSTDLESRLEDHLRHSAATAPAPMLRLTEIDARAAQRKRRRTLARSVLAIGVAVGMGAAVMAMRDPQSTEPAGPIETPLTRGGDTGLYTDLVKPGALALQLADGQRLSFAITAAPFYDGYGQQSIVSYGGYSTGRAQPIAVDLPLIPEPELGGDDHLVYWSGLPTSTSRVEFQLANGSVLAQTPIDGVAAFPVIEHAPSDTLIAFDGNGTELARASWSAVRIVGSGATDGGTVNHNYTSLGEPDNYGTVDVSKISGLSQAEEDAYRKFGDDTMRACLSTQGDAAWTACVQSTDAAVKEYLDGLG